MTDEIEKRMGEIRERQKGARGLSSRRRFLECAPADIDWLLGQLTASREECERLRTDNEFLRIRLGTNPEEANQ